MIQLQPDPSTNHSTTLCQKQFVTSRGGCQEQMQKVFFNFIHFLNYGTEVRYCTYEISSLKALVFRSKFIPRRLKA